MHPANLLQPWVLLRLVGGFVAVVMFARAARTSWRILRHFDVSRSSEGQLALERHAELAASLVRVASVVQVSLLVLAMLAGDRLSGSIRGAMCGYGVFRASPWGFRSLLATAFTAVVASVVSQLYVLDARVRSFDLVRPLARMAIVLAACAAVDFGLATAFALDLDLSVVASCCSVRLDAVASGTAAPAGLGGGARLAATVGALCAIGISALLAWRASRSPEPRLVVRAALASLVAVPFALAASLLEVAPYAFELPHHVCPFCLLRSSVLFLGYPLFGAIFIAVTSSLAAGIGAIVARSDASRSAQREFARGALRRELTAWSAAVIAGALPIAHYAFVAGGLDLFH